jgi:hypothetical protein
MAFLCVPCAWYVITPLTFSSVPSIHQKPSVT